MIDPPIHHSHLHRQPDVDKPLYYTLPQSLESRRLSPFEAFDNSYHFMKDGVDHRFTEVAMGLLLYIKADFGKAAIFSKIPRCPPEFFTQNYDLAQQSKLPHRCFEI
jgi:hypothetical protein